MAVLRANISELLKVELDHHLFEELGTFEYEDLLNALFEVTETKKRYEYGLTVGGFPLAPRKDEGDPLASKVMREGYKTTYEYKAYGMYCGISKEARMDELHGVIEDIPMAMKRALEATINYYISRIFSRATSTASCTVRVSGPTDSRAASDSAGPFPPRAACGAVTT